MPGATGAVSGMALLEEYHLIFAIANGGMV
jgi:hypothetical protein